MRLLDNGTVSSLSTNPFDDWNSNAEVDDIIRRQRNQSNTLFQRHEHAQSHIIHNTGPLNPATTVEIPPRASLLPPEDLDRILIANCGADNWAQLAEVQRDIVARLKGDILRPGMEGGRLLEVSKPEQVDIEFCVQSTRP
jgi:hypothetical protein